MATAFRRKGSRIVGKLDADEREVIAGLLEQTRDLLDPGHSQQDPSEPQDPVQELFASLERPIATPQEVADRDPALQRLLPEGNREDPQAAQEFRELTENSLRARKSATLATAIAALRDVPAGTSRIELDEGQAQSLMIALSDVRLVLAERLGIHTDADAERLHELAEDPQGQEEGTVFAVAVYELLTWMQECLAQSLLR